MKIVTEFPAFLIRNGVKAQADLTAAGKTPEEQEQALGESFKFEGDKLKHFMGSIEAATPKMEELKRVCVMSLSEGEAAPFGSKHVGDHAYVPEYFVAMTTKSAPAKDAGGRGGRGGPGGGAGGGRGGDRGGSSKPKSSPWGISPEEKAAKAAAKANAAATAKK